MKENLPPTVSSGLSIRGNPPGSADGLLGPIMLRPETSELFGMTAAQIVGHATCVEARRADGSWRPLGWDPPQVSRFDGQVLRADEMIALVPIARPVLIERDPGPRPDHKIKIAASSHKALWPLAGSEVTVHARQGSRRARLISINSHFEMPKPTDGSIATFRDAFELRAVDDRPVVSPGDAGALVTTVDGAWLGIVVAASSDVVFGAPLGTRAERERLVAPSDRQINGNKQRICLEAGYAHNAQFEALKAFQLHPGRKFNLGKKLAHAEVDVESVRRGYDAFGVEAA